MKLTKVALERKLLEAIPQKLLHDSLKNPPNQEKDSAEICSSSRSNAGTDKHPPKMNRGPRRYFDRRFRPLSERRRQKRDKQLRDSVTCDVANRRLKQCHSQRVELGTEHNLQRWPFCSFDPFHPSIMLFVAWVHHRLPVLRE